MSATIESDLFSMYFAVPVRGRVEGAPVVTVDGKSFPVVECYLEDLKDIGVSTVLEIGFCAYQGTCPHFFSLIRHELQNCQDISLSCTFIHDTFHWST